MSKIPKTLVIVLVVAGLGYAFGRYLQPAKVVTKVETKTKVVEVEVEKTKTEYRTIVKEITKPDGTKIKETTTENIKESNKKNVAKEENEVKIEKLVENLKPQWKAQAMADLNNLELNTYRVGVERRVFGPIFAGAYAETSLQSYGVSISMEF